jgi:hypothetical protein
MSSAGEARVTSRITSDWATTEPTAVVAMTVRNPPPNASSRRRPSATNRLLPT